MGIKILGLLGGVSILAFSQARVPAQYRDEVTYPSLTPRHVIKLDFGDWNGIWDPLGPRPAWDPLDKTAPFHDTSRYYVQNLTTTERVPFQRVEFPKCAKDDPDCKTDFDYTSAYLIFRPGQLRKEDKVAVFLIPPGQSGTPSGARNPRSNDVTIPALPPLQVALNPSYVPDLTLPDKTKHSVGHLAVGLTSQDVNLWRGHARSYFTTDALFSSDHKDPANKFDSRWTVAERALPGNWYLPVFLESKVVGDQRAENLSWVNSAGISGLIPWGWTRKALTGDLVQIPVSPIWRFAVQNEYRANQDAAAQKEFPDQNAIRLFGELTWDPIRLLPSKGSDTVTLELAGRGWYLPSDRNASGNKIERLEGQIEVSLLVPITKFQFNAPSLVANDKSAAKQRIRIRYAAGANEAQAFRHSAQLSLGVEFVK
jgi:hypothetical protein